MESGGESVWPADLHSYADLTTAKSEGLRLSRAEEADEDRTMKQLAEALEVTPRRITVLVDALEEHGPGRALPSSDRRAQHRRRDHGRRAQSPATGLPAAPGQGCGRLRGPAADDQRWLLAVSRDLTGIFRKRLADRSATGTADCIPDHGAARLLARRHRTAIHP